MVPLSSQMRFCHNNRPYLLRLLSVSSTSFVFGLPNNDEWLQINQKGYRFANNRRSASFGWPIPTSAPLNSTWTFSFKWKCHLWRVFGHTWIKGLRTRIERTGQQWFCFQTMRKWHRNFYIAKSLGIDTFWHFLKLSVYWWLCCPQIKLLCVNSRHAWTKLSWCEFIMCADVHRAKIACLVHNNKHYRGSLWYFHVFQTL